MLYPYTIEETSEKILAHLAVGWEPTFGSPLDAPTANWPLASLESALTIAGGYLLFVAIGMTVMPLLPGVPDKYLYPIKFVYNLVQVFLCAYMSVESGILAYRNNYTVLPIGKLNTFNAAAPAVGNLLWLFYLSKVLDFFDTITIVLQKKWNQLSFLHVYHHSSVFLFYWVNLRMGYDGDIYLTVLLNAAIHTVMYTYYFLSMHTKDIWWKKYLTMMQMVQFCIMITQAFCMMASGGKEFAPRLSAYYCVYIFSMLGLFAHFYVQSYKRKPSKEASKAEKKLQ